MRNPFEENYNDNIFYYNIALILWLRCLFDDRVQIEPRPRHFNQTK